ncbi:MAG: hypothetical protein Q7S98_03625 [Deltaproteobacteria bacterium]|nr:hypothetical protein [Deltaproteobacteria bacterium]
MATTSGNNCWIHGVRYGLAPRFLELRENLLPWAVSQSPGQTAEKGEATASLLPDTSTWVNLQFQFGPCDEVAGFDVGYELTSTRLPAFPITDRRGNINPLETTEHRLLLGLSRYNGRISLANHWRINGTSGAYLTPTIMRGDQNIDGHIRDAFVLRGTLKRGVELQGGPVALGIELQTDSLIRNGRAVFDYSIPRLDNTFFVYLAYHPYDAPDYDVASHGIASMPLSNFDFANYMSVALVGAQAAGRGARIAADASQLGAFKDDATSLALMEGATTSYQAAWAQRQVLERGEKPYMPISVAGANAVAAVACGLAANDSAEGRACIGLTAPMAVTAGVDLLLDYKHVTSPHWRRTAELLAGAATIVIGRAADEHGDIQAAVTTGASGLVIDPVIAWVTELF